MYRSSTLAGVLLGAIAALAQDCTGINAVSPKCQSKEAAYHRDFFYIGGSYVSSRIPGQNVPGGQLYVEKLTPLDGVQHEHPVVFVSAGLPAGNVWLNTPDNRQGWASYFVESGFQVCVVDIVANGRSSQNEVTKYPFRLGSTDVINEQGFTAPELYEQYPQAVNHTQWPGNGTRGDPIFDAFTFSNIPLSSANIAVEDAMQADGCQLLGLIGQSYTICHSAGCTYTALWSDMCPESVRANINLEPGNFPFQSLIGKTTVPGVGRTTSRPCGLSFTPLNYDPPVADCAIDIQPVMVGEDLPGNRSCFIQSGTIRSLPQLARVPYVMLTADASPHITYDHCFVEYLAQAGVENVEWILLGNQGLKGNGHFFFLELNNLDIADVVIDKIQTMDGGPGSPLR